MNVDHFTLHAIDAIDAVVEPFAWPFVEHFAAEIEAVWRRELEQKPRSFNGKVLIQHRGRVDGRVFRCAYDTVEFKQFIAWHRLDYPPPAVRNGFGMAALQSADGAFLLGEMGAHTTNAGRIYFAAGTPDPSDIQGSRVDLAGSVLRELQEETGLRAEEVAVGAGWTAVLGAHRVAFMRPVRIDLPAAEARALLLERVRSQADPELADIHIVRSPADIDEARMPPFQKAFLRHAFSAD